jgi:hypothetical protein
MNVAPDVFYVVASCIAHLQLLQEFPSELASMASLRALYLDDNAITVLVRSYLASLVSVVHFVNANSCPE